MATKETKAIIDAVAETTVKALPVVKTTLKVKVKKLVTREQLKLKIGVPVYINILSPIYQAEADPKIKSDMEPPKLANVVDLETGQEMTMIFATVLEQELTKQYVNDSYVGLSFSVEQFKIDGKRYSGFRIAEIEIEA